MVIEAKKPWLLWLLLLVLLSNLGWSNTQTEMIMDRVKVGTEGTYNPFTYRDTSGKLTGYDIEVLREIERRDPTLSFEFVVSPWETLFPGLDANKFQLLANQIVANPDRERRYYLTDESYFISVSQLIVKAGRKDIQQLPDLKQKKLGSIVGSSHTRIIEDWNIAHNDALKIIYYEGDIQMILQDIHNGRLDATVNDPIMAKNKAKAQGLDIEIVGERIAAYPTRFITKKDATGLRIKQKIDRALAAMHKDGTLSAMSIQQFGKDYTQ